MKITFFFIHVFHLHYIFHSCTISENNENLTSLIDSYLAFCFLLFSMITSVLQLGVNIKHGLDRGIQFKLHSALRLRYCVLTLIGFLTTWPVRCQEIHAKRNNVEQKISDLFQGAEEEAKVKGTPRILQTAKAVRKEQVSHSPKTEFLKCLNY